MLSSHATRVGAEDEINLREYWHVLLRRRWFVVRTVCAVVVLTVVVTLLLPDIYQSKAVLIPLGKPTSTLQSALGELGSLLPIGAASTENPATRLLAILQSRTLAEEVIQRLDLMPRLFAKSWDVDQKRWQTDEPPTMSEAVKMMQEEVVASAWDEQKGIITITVEYTDAALAAAVANTYIETLQRSLNENAFTLAKKNRVFVEAQLDKTREDLNAAEEALRQFELVYGIVALDVQAQAAVTALATLEGQIMAKEVQLGVLQRTLTGSSREVYLLQEELKELRTQLTRLQQSDAAAAAASEAQRPVIQSSLSLDKAPEIKLQYARLQRDSLIQNKLFTLLTQQLEQARIEEARDETAFQLLDKAVPAEEKAKPRRALIVALVAVASTFIGALLAFFRDSVDTTLRTREQVERQAGIAILASLPSSGPPQRRRRAQAQTVEDSHLLQPLSDGPRSEALRYLHTRVKHYNREQRVQSLLLVSPGPDEGATMTLVNLALVAASVGEKILLIDSDLRRPELHQLLQCSPTPGLVDILIDPESWQKGIHTTHVENLHLVPAGSVTPQAPMALESPAFSVLLARFRTMYDLILCAAPPICRYTDAAVLSATLDATCLILTYGVSRVDALLEAKVALEAVQGNIIGAVVVGLPG
jgi:capsular exopolysaccharide synthesis family protein